MKHLDLSRPYCIEPGAARAYLRLYDSIMARKNSGLLLKGERYEGEQLLEQSPVYHSIKNLEGREGVRVEMGNGIVSNWTLREGVATINLIGPVIRYGDYFSAMSGLSSTDAIAKQLSQTLAHSEVHTILLNMDSPGGDATSINEVAAQIRAANAQKRVVSYGDGMVCSAAYWMAAASDEIVLSASGVAGSIGTIWGIMDDTKSLAMRGYELTEFVSSQSPNKNPDPKSKSGKAQYQQLVDDMTTVFATDVAAYRGVSVETVYKNYGAGGVMIGVAAVKAGLVDRLGDYESLHAELVADGGQKRLHTGGAATADSTRVAVAQISERVAALPKKDRRRTASNLNQEEKTTMEDEEIQAEEDVDSDADASTEGEAAEVETEAPDAIEALTPDDDELISVSLDPTPENIARLQSQLATRNTQLSQVRTSQAATLAERAGDARTAFASSLKHKVAPVARPQFNALFGALQKGAATPAMLETALANLPKNKLFEPIPTDLTEVTPPVAPKNETAERDEADAKAYAARRNRKPATAKGGN